MYKQSLVAIEEYSNDGTSTLKESTAVKLGLRKLRMLSIFVYLI